ncbi:unnamed protein product [Penicillium roqueforti FM164]|uniref:Uncharacterized protein n=1 Tax=Penicillium roqueforti (strain FM164) TaxID=1365484 RepID=W6R6T9_PENRF|nr:unnamed protein product [Penicillium roqueforti FM164]
MGPSICGQKPFGHRHKEQYLGGYNLHFIWQHIYTSAWSPTSQALQPSLYSRFRHRRLQLHFSRRRCQGYSRQFQPDQSPHERHFYYAACLSR